MCISWAAANWGRCSSTRESPRLRQSRFCGPFSFSASPPSAARSRIWAISAANSWKNAAGCRIEDFAGLLALCQFLPGPASSQVGFCIGLKRAGVARRAGRLARFYPPLRRADGSPRPLGRPVPDHARRRAAPCTAWSWRRSPWSRRRCGAWRQPVPGHAAPRPGATCFGRPLVCCPNTGGQICVLLLGAVLGRLILTPTQRLAATSRHDRAPLPHGPALLCLGIFLLLLIFAFIAPHSGAAGAVRGILPGGRFGLRRRPCRPALAARCRRGAGLGLAATLSCRIRRGTGHAGPALHRRGLSRRGEQRRPERRAGRHHRHTRDLPPGPAAGHRRPALLAKHSSTGPGFRP